MKRKHKFEPISEPKTREQLELQHGQVWDTKQLAAEFIVTSIIGTTVVVRRKVDGMVGSLEYQNQPRYYFGFRSQQMAG